MSSVCPMELRVLETGRIGDVEAAQVAGAIERRDGRQTAGAAFSSEGRRGQG
jgi:hypothetical protein